MFVSRTASTFSSSLASLFLVFSLGWVSYTGCSDASEIAPEERFYRYGWVNTLDRFLPTSVGDRRWGWTEDYHPINSKECYTIEDPGDGSIKFKEFSLNHLHKVLQKEMEGFFSAKNRKNQKQGQGNAIAKGPNYCCAALTFCVRNDSGDAEDNQVPKSTYYTYYFPVTATQEAKSDSRKLFFMSGSGDNEKGSTKKNPQRSDKISCLPTDAFDLWLIYSKYEERLDGKDLSGTVKRQLEQIRDGITEFHEKVKPLQEELVRELSEMKSVSFPNLAQELFEQEFFSGKSKSRNTFKKQYSDAWVPYGKSHGSLLDSEQYLLTYFNSIYHDADASFSCERFVLGKIEYFHTKERCNIEKQNLVLRADKVARDAPGQLCNIYERNFYVEGEVESMILSIHSLRELCEVCAASCSCFVQDHNKDLANAKKLPPLIIVTSSHQKTVLYQDDIDNNGRCGGIGGNYGGDEFCQEYNYKSACSDTRNDEKDPPDEGYFFVPQLFLGDDNAAAAREKGKGSAEDDEGSS